LSTQPKIVDIAIIGAGASGLMLASHLKNRSILLIDANPVIGAKLKISGGGRCNITNKFMNSDFFDGNISFINQVLTNFTTSDLLNFLEKYNLKPTIENKSVNGQYFCKSSSEIIDVFAKSTKHVNFMMNTKVLKVDKNGHFKITTDKDTIAADILIVASGGISYPILNSSTIGYEIAKLFGHTIIETKPALVGLSVQKEQFWMKELSGISLPVIIEIGNKNINGDLLFTHKGISGPAVLNASLYWQKGHITIDFLPFSTIQNMLKDKNKQISTQLNLPKNFTKAFLLHIGMEDKQIAKLKKVEIEKLETLKKYPLSPAGTFGYSKAEVTKGGVSTEEIDAKSMESKLCKNLYFIGECLNVTGSLGGYNLHWAFSSALTCSKKLKLKYIK